MTENSRLRVANSGPRAFAPDFATNAAIGRWLQCVANPDPTKPLDVRWADLVVPQFTNLTNLLYVNQGTAVPAADQIGNIEQPFATLAAGIARAIVLAAPTIINVTLADYSAEVIPAMPAAPLGISSLDVPYHCQLGVSVLLPDLPAGCTDLSIYGCAYNNVTADNVLLVDSSYNIVGTVTAAALYSFETLLGLSVATASFIQGGTLRDVLTSVDLDARDLVIEHDIVLTGGPGTTNSVFLYDCAWRNAAADVNLGNAAGGTPAVKMRNCSFWDGPPARKCTLLSAGGGTLNIDAPSYSSLLASGVGVGDIGLTLTMASSPQPAAVLGVGTNILAGAIAPVAITVPGVPANAVFGYSTSIALDAGLCVRDIYRSGANTVTVEVMNVTAAPINTAANITFRVVVL